MQTSPIPTKRLINHRPKRRLIRETAIEAHTTEPTAHAPAKPKANATIFYSSFPIIYYINNGQNADITIRLFLQWLVFLKMFQSLRERHAGQGKHLRLFLL